MKILDVVIHYNIVVSRFGLYSRTTIFAKTKQTRWIDCITTISMPLALVSLYVQRVHQKWTFDMCASTSNSGVNTIVNISMKSAFFHPNESITFRCIKNKHENHFVYEENFHNTGKMVNDLCFDLFFSSSLFFKGEKIEEWNTLCMQSIAFEQHNTSEYSEAVCSSFFASNKIFRASVSKYQQKTKVSG